MIQLKFKSYLNIKVKDLHHSIEPCVCLCVGGNKRFTKCQDRNEELQTRVLKVGY